MPRAEQYAEAKRIFLEAVEMPLSERAAFVEGRCAHDASLGERVRRMLAADDDGEFLGDGAFAPSPVGLPAGTVLGRYRIVRVLGEGGMGVVYEAEQDEPARRVALKVIQPGFLSESLRSRFRHEIRVLGQLRHPGIAQIYDAGTLEVGGGRVPYFAMELIEGRPLLECAEAMKLGVRERLELIAQVCDAAHHAHQKGVVHRDLKPANILVEEGGPSLRDGTRCGATGHPLQVKVLDFGVARVTDADVRAAVTIHTSAHQLVGTVPYMSPEQAAADPEGVDIRTDVYSIGVVAFELLAGRLPHAIQGRGLQEAVRAIREDEPARLGSIDRALRGDIDTIIAKALEKDRDRRYGSAAEMGADIRRFLRHEPIAARPPSALYHLRTYARRHKPLVLAAVTVMLAMVVTTGVSVWQARVAQGARVFAEGEQKRADLAAAAARRAANRATLIGAAAAIANRDPITASRLLDDTDERDRGWGWRHWHSRLDESVAMVRPGVGPGGRIAGAWISADGGEVAVVTVDGAVRRGSPWSGELAEVARLADAPAQRAVFIDDGRRILTDGPDQRSLTLFDAADGRAIHRHEPFEAPIGLLEASPDGRLVVVGLNRPGQPPGGLPNSDAPRLGALTRSGSSGPPSRARDGCGTAPQLQGLRPPRSLPTANG